MVDDIVEVGPQGLGDRILRGAVAQSLGEPVEVCRRVEDVYDLFAQSVDALGGAGSPLKTWRSMPSLSFWSPSMTGKYPSTTPSRSR